MWQKLKCHVWTCYSDLYNGLYPTTVLIYSGVLLLLLVVGFCFCRIFFCMHVCGGQRSISDGIFRTSRLVFSGRSLTGNWGLPVVLGWLACVDLYTCLFNFLYSVWVCFVWLWCTHLVWKAPLEYMQCRSGSKKFSYCRMPLKKNLEIFKLLSQFFFWIRGL